MKLTSNNKYQAFLLIISNISMILFSALGSKLQNTREHTTLQSKLLLRNS